MSKQRWFLPTNTENLELFLSNGLMTCASGLGDAYMKDIMADYSPGYIPFFSINKLKVAIEKSTLEDDNLIRCVIELDLSQILSMSLYASFGQVANEPKAQFSYKELNVDNIKNDSDQYETLLIPSPLPIQCIKNIIFESTPNKNDTAKDLDRKFGYYPDKFFITEAKIFKSTKQLDDLLNHEELINYNDILARDVDYNKIFSLGGMLALTFYQSKNGIISANYFNEVCILKKISQHSHLDFELFNNYYYDTSLNNSEYKLLFFDLIKIISLNKGSVSEIKLEVLNYLDTTKDTKGSAALMGKSLRDIEERLINLSPEEVFTNLKEQHTSRGNTEIKKIRMLLVMYFFRDKIETMLKFYHKDFEDIDYILFAMLFGLDSRYIGLPSHIKKIKGLDFYISNRMSEYHHQLNDNTTSFKSVTHPKFIINDLIKEKSNGELDNFVKWFSDDFLSLEQDKFQSWEIKVTNKGYTSVSKTVLKFEEEPDVVTKISMTELKSQLFEFCNEMKDKLTKKLFETLNLNPKSLQKWELTNKGFSCEGSTKLAFKEKPKLTALINIPEFEQQLIVATIGNDKDLFDYNEVYSKYESLKK